MADRLASAGIGSNVTQATFLDYVGRHDEVDNEIQDAKETVRSLNKRRKDLRKTMKASGLNLEAFDRHLMDVNRSGEEREADDREYRRYMSWRNKPVGFQPSMDLQGDANIKALNANELAAIDREGFDAGKSGRRRDSNPWETGSELAQRWDSHWLEGQGSIADSMGPDPAAGEGAAAAKRGRGRPRKDTTPAPPNDIARAQGKADALAGVRDHAARWAPGEAGHADYALGYAEGEKERHNNQGELVNGATPAPRRRGRPPRTAQEHPDQTPAA